MSLLLNHTFIFHLLTSTAHLLVSILLPYSRNQWTWQSHSAIFHKSTYENNSIIKQQYKISIPVTQPFMSHAKKTFNSQMKPVYISTFFSRELYQCLLLLSPITTLSFSHLCLYHKLKIQTISHKHCYFFSLHKSSPPRQCPLYFMQ